MNAAGPRPQPESWDEATDLRRFWWLVFPIGMAVWAAGILIFFDGGGTALSWFREPVTRSDRFEQSFPMVAGDQLLLNNIRGPVHIRNGPAGQATVVIERRGRGRTGEEARRAVESYRVFVRPGASTTTVIVAGTEGGPYAAETRVLITVPPGARLKAETLQGDMTIEVEGPVQVAAGTAGGNIDVRLPKDAAVTTRVDAREFEAEFQLQRTVQGAGNVVFEKAGQGAGTVELDLLAPAGRVTLRLR
jgi:hypothetical protein